MATNLALDDELVRDAVTFGGHKTKKAAVNAALEEYVRRRKQVRIIELFGTIDYYDDYDPQKARLLDRVEVEP